MSNPLVLCPFCQEGNFDLIGLKHHLENEYCEVYQKTITPEEESRIRKMKQFEVNE